MPSRIGVYICHCGINIAATVNSKEVAAYAAVARDYMYMCSDPGQEMIRQDILDYGLTRVVVASCSPRMHEVTFRHVVEDTGLNPYYFEMANIREQCSWVHTDIDISTEKAKELVAGAAAKASLLEALQEREVNVTRAALIIGGGIAGLEAALDIADAGHKVYLVEKQPSLGGRMAQLNKTFPRLEDAGTLVHGEMVRAIEHPNIEVLAYSEVANVEGYIGNFQATVVRKPRFVDPARCTACGKCAEACVLAGQVPDDFQMGMGQRAAIYQPFPRALPPTYTVDPAHCLLLKDGLRSGLPGEGRRFRPAATGGQSRRGDHRRRHRL
jgi:heterodisulfide reductase subunit A